MRSVHRFACASAATLLLVGAACKKGAPEKAGAPSGAEAGPSGESSQPQQSTGEVARAAVERVAVRVVDPSNGPPRELYPRLLAKRMGSTLEGSGWFLPAAELAASGSARSARVDLRVGYSLVPEGNEGKPAVIAVVEASVEWTDGRGGLASSMNVLAERSYGPEEEPGLDGIVASHVERAVGDAAAGLIAKERIRVGPDEVVLEALSGAELDTRVWAMAVVGERGLLAAAPRVRDLLGSAEEAERDAAIGTAIALRDREAVSVLTRLAEFTDYALMRRVIEAVVAIGGEEAHDYLEFVASGHPDSDIQEQAKEALTRRSWGGREQ